jgi:hypothetical protein
MAFVDEFTIRISGKRNRQGPINYLEKNRHSRTPQRSWERCDTIGGKSLEEIAQELKQQEADVKQRQRALAKLEEQQAAVASKLRRSDVPYSQLREARLATRTIRKEIEPKEQDLKRTRQELYRLNKTQKRLLSSLSAISTLTSIDGTTSSSPISPIASANTTNITTSTTTTTSTTIATKNKKPPHKKLTTPSWNRPGVEEHTENLDISHLINNASNGTIVFPGTDYGLVVTSQTSALTVGQLHHHIQLYNRFNVLTQDDSNGDGDANENYHQRHRRHPE